MTRTLVCPSVIAFTACAVLAQAAPAASPAFDVASIKPNTAMVRNEGHMIDDISVGADTVSVRNVSLQGCIRWAYDIRGYQVSGPGWINSDRFDITAKAAAAASEADLRQMMHTLLADRFGLKVHTEKKEMSVFALTVGKNGPKFKPSEGEGKSVMSGGGMVMTAKWTTMGQFADLLYQPLRTPVVDQTGLKGQYDFKVDLTAYAPTNADGAREPGPMGDPAGIVLSIVQEQLGLKFESKKSALDILVVDHAEKLPTDN